MKEIISTKEIQLLVETFYNRVRKDAQLGPIFNSVIKTESDWQLHMNRLVEFWESILFQSNGYEGNPMQAHVDVNNGYEGGLLPNHFDKWLELWVDTIDGHFIGEKATMAKKRANLIAMAVQSKLKDLDQHS